MSKVFNLVTDFSESEDQLKAINQISQNIEKGKKDQILLGITGSGKTFTMASVINKLQRPAIIMAHNKTLAAQLYNEMKNFFPTNSVEYFISYYDYYQPEAYISSTDTYIEKDSAINDQIDQMRHSATKAILERKDTIIIASVSAIYGLGEPDDYSSMRINLQIGDLIDLNVLAKRLAELQYVRNDVEFKRGRFRVRGDVIYIFPPSYENIAVKVDFFGDEIESISEFDIITGKTISELHSISIFPNGHYVAPLNKIKSCIPKILEDLEERVQFFKSIGKNVEAYRINQRVRYDVEMMMEIGYCKGIENYSRYLTGRQIGYPPPTLFEYLQKDAILFIDESHVTLPQIKAMYNGDRARKANLIDFGFRLPSAFDNRPLKFEEWDKIRPNTVFVSATPGKIEIEKTQGEVIEQLIRPTGLLDPLCEVRKIENQIEDSMNEVKKAKERNSRVICITVTKKYSERLNEYFIENGLKSMYLHSDIETIERIATIQKLRSGKIDVIIGINLLREGIDIPECDMVLILDADKEGFLRSETALIQIIGRAARNANGKVILYADLITESMKKALGETTRRREIQDAYNKKNNIIPKTILKKLESNFDEMINFDDLGASERSIVEKYKNLSKAELSKEVKKFEKAMKAAAKKLDFDLASELRDKMQILIKMTGGK